MYTYRTEALYRSDMPQTAFSAPIQPRGIACHWTAGGIGRTGALSTISFLAGSTTRNASYHEVWYWERASRIFGVIRIVPARNAAHSMNPGQPPWNPVTEVRRILGDRWWDPNRYSYAVSYAGGPSHLATDLNDPDFVDGCARRIRELLGELSGSLAERPLFTHAEGQPGNKADWGTALTPLIYGRLTALPDTSIGGDMRLAGSFVEFVGRHSTVTPTDGANFRAVPDLSETDVPVLPQNARPFVIARVVGEAVNGNANWYAAVDIVNGQRTVGYLHSTVHRLDPALVAEDCEPKVTAAVKATRLDVAEDLETFAATLKQ